MLYGKDFIKKIYVKLIDESFNVNSESILNKNESIVQKLVENYTFHNSITHGMIFDIIHLSNCTGKLIYILKILNLLPKKEIVAEYKYSQNVSPINDITTLNLISIFSSCLQKYYPHCEISENDNMFFCMLVYLKQNTIRSHK
tara:strand:- start:244 stop:672 length:429 start_codon:yes stop_codon:yes gene_type:complete